MVVTYISSDRPPNLPCTGIKKNAYPKGEGWYLGCIDDVVLMD